MSIVHLVGGEKGGIGKSFFVKILVSYHRRMRLPFSLYEADEVNQDIWRTYKDEFPVGQVVFSKAERELRWPNELLYSAEDGDVVVNLPAAVYKRIGEWYKANRLGEQLDELGIKLYVWYLCDGDATNIRLFRESQATINAPHIFVQNMIRLTEAEWAEQLATHGLELDKIPHLVLERLGVEGEIMANEYLSFESFLSKDLREKRIGRIEKRIVELFLGDMIKRVRGVMDSLTYGKARVQGNEAQEIEEVEEEDEDSQDFIYQVRDYTGSYSLDREKFFLSYQEALDYVIEVTGLGIEECEQMLRERKLEIIDVPA